MKAATDLVSEWMPGAEVESGPRPTLAARLAAQLTLCFLAASLFLPRLTSMPFQVEDGILLLAMAVWLLSGSLTADARAVVVYVACCAAAIGALASVGLAFGAAGGAFRVTEQTTLKEVGRLGKHVIIAYCLLKLQAQSASGSRIRTAILVLMAFHCAAGLSQYLGIQPIKDLIETHFMEDRTQAFNVQEAAIADGSFRATGTVYNPNIYGQLALFLGTSATLAWRDRRLQRAAAMLLMVVCLLLSQSRTAILGGMPALYLAVLRSNRARSLTKRATAALAGLAVIVGILLYAGQGTAINDRLLGTLRDGGGVVVANRPQYLEVTAEILDRSPMIGFGLGAMWSGPVDSDLLYVLTQAGLFGLGVLVAYYGGLLILGRRLGRRCTAFVLMSLLCGSTNGVFFGNEIMPFAYLLLATEWIGSPERRDRAASIDGRWK